MRKEKNLKTRKKSQQLTRLIPGIVSFRALSILVRQLFFKMKVSSKPIIKCIKAKNRIFVF
jgi:hypothetical protein